MADIQTGLYGDLERSLRSAAQSDAEAAAVIVEWSDLDPRLGLRTAGGWALSVQADILEICHQGLARLMGGLRALAARMHVALVPPTLPTVLLGHTAGWQASLSELELQKRVAIFLARQGNHLIQVVHRSSSNKILSTSDPTPLVVP